MIKHLVMFSGGICSWATAKRVVEKHGTQDVTLLFADTHMEDEDLYRFLDQAEANIGAPLVRIAEGRTPWEVMRDKRMIYNTRMDGCSMVLKRALLDKWRATHCDPAVTITYIGLDWTEVNRFERVRERLLPWKVESPLVTDPPFLSKQEMMDWLKREGIEPPRLYGMGFSHNNCGGFCVKAGQAHFANLWRTMPERYLYHESQEEQMRAIVGDYSILRDRRGGKVSVLTLRTFRGWLEKGDACDPHDIGGCGCALE